MKVCTYWRSLYRVGRDTPEPNARGDHVRPRLVQAAVSEPRIPRIHPWGVSMPWRHGISPAPVDFHHYIQLASMAQQRGLEPPSRMNSPTTRFPGGPTTSYRTAASVPAEPFSYCFIAADRTESRNTREYVADVFWRQEWDSNPQAMFQTVGFRDRLATITTPCRVAKREGLEPSNPICRGQTD